MVFCVLRKVWDITKNSWTFGVFLKIIHEIYNKMIRSTVQKILAWPTF